MLDNIEISEDAEYFTDGKDIFVKKGERYVRLSLFDKHFYKLSLYNGVPILEVDGLRMHLVEDFENPLQYSEGIVKHLGVKKGAKVLDTCMGLGYTAMAAAKKGARVTTIEISNAVIKLAELNPEGKGLFGNKNIDIKHGNSFDLIKESEDEFFSFVIHDPPRFSHAGELYSAEFYKELYRITKKSAKLFHYVGSLGKRKGRSIGMQVKKRLTAAGFARIKEDERFQGLFFSK